MILSKNKSSNFNEKSTNKKESSNSYYRSYTDKYIRHLESEIQQKNQQIDDLIIALKQEQSLNLNNQNILGNDSKIEEDNINTKENIIVPEKNESKKSFFSKLFKKKI